MSCVNSNSQVVLDPDYRECWLCKQRLHKSSFYKENIKKYFNCIPCERARLAKLRDKCRYTETEDGQCCYACPRCRKPIDMNKLENGDKRFEYYNCPCEAHCRVARCKDANARTGACYGTAKAKCPYCGKWGCTAFNPHVCCKGDFYSNEIGNIHKIEMQE